MERTLDTTRLDEMAAQAIAGIAAEAEEQCAAPFFETMMAEVERRAPRERRYTAAEFFHREPEKFRAVVGYIAEGRGQLWIADRVGCSHHTVRAVRDRFPMAVAIEKERLADRCQTAATLLVDKIIEEPDKVPAQSWGLTAAQLIDKMILLRGGATVITEKRHVFTHEDFNRLLDAAPIEIEAEAMGSAGEKAGQRADSAMDQEAPAGDQVGPRTDSASLDLQRNDPAATLPATPDPASEGGEGGVPAATRGVASHVA